MSASYDLWLCDDSGKRILLLDRTAFFSYSRVINGYGTCQVGIPYRLFREKVWPVFSPDRRIEFWRSPATGSPMKQEGVYLLREQRVYTREEDNVDIIEFFGRSPIDLLSRRWVIQAAGTSYADKTAAIDDMMKEIVREQMLYGSARDYDEILANRRAYPRGEFSVQVDLTLGPVISRSFAGRNVLDVLKELRDTSFQLYEDDPSTNRKIYFDVVSAATNAGEIFIFQESGTNIPILDELGNEILDEGSQTLLTQAGLQFQTFADLRGIDRTDRLVFSVANSNLKGPQYSRNHFDERNSIIVKGPGRGESKVTVVVEDDARRTASRWNHYEEVIEESSATEVSMLVDAGTGQLRMGKPREELIAVFLNNAGGEDAPRSLYGIDWDLGDRLPVWYADQLFLCEVVVVYVGVDENGVETITGRNTVESL